MAKFKQPVILLNQNVPNAGPVQSTPLTILDLNHAAFQIEVTGGNLQATIQILGSLDGKNFVDLQEVVPPLTGGNQDVLVNLPGVAVPYLQLQITPSAGSAPVVVWGSAKAI